MRAVREEIVDQREIEAGLVGIDLIATAAKHAAGNNGLGHGDTLLARCDEPEGPTKRATGKQPRPLGGGGSRGCYRIRRRRGESRTGMAGGKTDPGVWVNPASSAGNA